MSPTAAAEHRIFPMRQDHPFHFLSAAFSYPGQEDRLLPTATALTALAADLELQAPSAEELIPGPLPELQAEYVRLFDNAPGGVPAPPWSSVYLGGSSVLMQQGHDQALAFYRQAGIEPTGGNEYADHLIHELAFVGILLDRDRLSLLARFLDRHLLRWYPPFHRRLQEADPCPFYSLLGRVTDLCLHHIAKEVT
ncbi:molecular chaperone [Thermodesulfobacteriota bacterium B35]